MLALAQAGQIADRIRERHPGTAVEIEVIRTRGDVLQDAPLDRIGGKGIFVREIEEALRDGRIDLAVHSMKDMPVELAEGLVLGAVPEREDPRDVFVSPNRGSLRALPPHARIGTGSLRRRCQLLRLLPGARVVSLRGNLDTRLRKIASEKLDGIIVAAAGLRRMGWTERIAEYLPVTDWVPAPGQGAIGLELRRGDAVTAGRIAFLDHPPTSAETSAERAFLRRLGGGCQLPVGACGSARGDRLMVWGFVSDPDGREIVRREIRGVARESESLGTILADLLLADGARKMLEAAYGGTR